MRERKELVEAPQLRRSVAHLSFSINRGRRTVLRLRLHRRWRGVVFLTFRAGRLARFLRSLGILSSTAILDLFPALGSGGGRRWRGILVRRRPERRRAGDDVQQPSNVRSGAIFIVVLCIVNDGGIKGKQHLLVDTTPHKSFIFHFNFLIFTFH